MNNKIKNSINNFKFDNSLEIKINLKKDSIENQLNFLLENEKYSFFKERSLIIKLKNHILETLKNFCEIDKNIFVDFHSLFFDFEKELFKCYFIEIINTTEGIIVNKKACFLWINLKDFEKTDEINIYPFDNMEDFEIFQKQMENKINSSANSYRIINDMKNEITMKIIYSDGSSSDFVPKTKKDNSEYESFLVCDDE